MPLDKWEFRRRKGAIKRVTTTLTLDPAVHQFLKEVAPILKKPVSYVVEDAIIESATLQKFVEENKESYRNLYRIWEYIKPGEIQVAVSPDQEERLRRWGLKDKK